QDDVMSGFIGVDNPRLFNADHVIVKTASSLVFGTLLRYRSEMLKRERDAQNDEVWVLQDMLRTARWSIEFGDDGLVSGAEWSQDFRKLLGFESIDDFPNTLEAWSQRVHPDDIQWVLDAFYAASKDRLGHVRFNVEYRIRHKNGLYRWLHAVAKFRHDENGHVVWAIGVSNDVSDAHELASLQAKEKENINRVMSLTDDFESIYDVNVDTGEYVVSNKSGVFTEDLLENLEFGPDYFESAARNIRVATYEKDKAMFQESLSKENILKVLDANQFFYIDYRLLIDGKPVWYRMKIVKVGNWGKEHRVLIGVFNNDRNKRQDDERQAYSEMAMALSASYECIYYVNLLDDSYIEFNKKGDFKKLDMEITGKDFFHSTMRNLKDVAYEEDLEMVSEFINKENIVKAVEEGETLSREYRIKFGDNFIHYRMKVAKSKSSKHHLVVAVENVEEEVRRRDVQQKQLEEALQMAQAANRAKTAFLNNMSHDIRTPMNAIIGFSGLAASHIDNREQVLDYLRKIGQSSDHLLSLINEVLDMSRIESGKMMLNEKDENLSEILHTLRDIIQADINAKQLELFIDTVDVTHENVICDKLRLNQVLLNITSNAIKYTRPGGTITIRMMQKKVTPNGYATYEFHIKDTGIGMSQEYVRTIFEPFTRESTSTVSGIQGTGLGMAISKNIVDMMGGKIDVTTKKDEGTEFVLTIDFKLGSNKQGEPTRIPQFEGLRGLVVDDDSSTCLSISRMLRDAGMRSEWCVSGKEAILRTTEAMQIGDLYKVYIIDWMMPDMNGIETTRRIRRVVGDNIPIIILTAYDWSDIENEAREAGVSGFVSKPMFPSDLHKALLQFCDGEKEEEAKAEPDMEFYGKKILLVDDNELNCEIAKELLEDNGFVVDTAADGTLAVEKMKSARSDDYDMILMDIQMPIMNGYDATRAIRAIDSEICKGIPIIAMTANAFAEDKEEALKAGMNDHIAKPIKVKILIETLRRYLNR
ncbi:MAG: response regulator, partial [Victivallales bacterium]|nr:response regulator [Victivallales bacterium]